MDWLGWVVLLFMTFCVVVVVMGFLWDANNRD